MTSGDDCSWDKLLLESVDQLYHFRDFFFEDHSTEEAGRKDELVSQRLDQVLDLFDSHQDEAIRQDKAAYLALRGRALNVVSEFKPEALDALSRAVKLNPRLVEAWNELGECYWKKGELAAAKTCFEGSLKQAPNKVGLRKLSMLLRQMGENPEQKNQISLSKAREAVALDMTDGISWYYLGNALLAHFFLQYQNPKVLQEALEAYDKALSDPATRCEPNIYYNRSIALKFKEQYQAALSGLDQACHWDPTWEAPKEEKEGLLAYLGQVRGLVASKGQLKARRIQQLLKALKLPAHLGPLTAPHRPLAQLQPGPNPGVVAVGKVVASLPPHHSLAFTFGLVDSADGPCLSLTVYNLATGRGFIIGDTVAIPDPVVEEVSVHHEGQEFNFRTIRVANPMVLVVNGRKLDPSSVAPLQLHVTVKSE